MSNIPWNSENDLDAYQTLKNLGVRNIDIAPTKVFETLNLTDVTSEQISEFKHTLRQYDLGVAALQSLAFGMSGNILDGDRESRQALRNRVVDAIHVAEAVGAHTIIYGSPATRINQTIDDKEAHERALEFFAPIDRSARDSGIVLGIEPVSTSWTDNHPVFGQTAASLIRFAEQGKREGLESTRLVADTFAIHDAHEDPQYVILDAAHKGLLAPHMQIAEPKLAVHSRDSPIDHGSFADSYNAALPHLNAAYPDITPTIAIEMKAGQSPDEDLGNIQQAVQIARTQYK